jgi:hypothetical protein
MADSSIETEIAIIDKASASLAQIAKNLESFRNNADKSFSGATRAFEVFEGSLAANLVEKGIEGLTEAAHRLFEVFVRDGIKSALEQENAISQLNNALARAGFYSKEASADFQEYAEKLQSTTKFSNESVIQTGALIESLGQLSEVELKSATTAAADLAAALNIDLETAARRLALAAEGNTTAFKKWGVVVAESTTNAGTFANAVDAINKKFGGAAQGQINTYSGRIAQIEHNFDDLIKVFGQAFIENNTLISGFGEINRILGELTKTAQNNKEGIKKFVGEGILLAIDACGVFLSVLQALTTVFKADVAIITAGANAIGAAFEATAQAMQGNFKNAFNTVKNSAQSGLQGVKNAFDENKTLAEIQNLLASIRGAAKAGFDSMSSGASASAQVVNGSIDPIKNLTAEMKLAGEAGKKLADSLINIPVEEKLKQEFELLKSQREADLIDLQTYYDARVKIQDQSISVENANLAEARRQNLIDDSVFSKAKVELDQRAARQREQIDNEFHKQQFQNLRDSLGNIAGLMKSTNLTLFRIGQAAAISQATIDGFLAIQKALAAAPPPFNFALAGLVGLATGANIASIAGQSPPQLSGGLDEVPAGYMGDNFPAYLQTGERVVPRETNRDLKTFLAGDGPMIGLLASINDKLSQLENHIVVNVGGREVINEIRGQLQAGRSFA